MNSIALFQNTAEIQGFGFPEAVVNYINSQFSDQKFSYESYSSDGHFFLVKTGKQTGHLELERLRVEGSRIAKQSAELKLDSVELKYASTKSEEAFALAEGFLLAQYQFLEFTS